MMDQDMRDRILAEPETILEDRDVMNALIGANERLMGGNVVDLRGIAMERLENRLDRLEDTHRTVIAAAYENLAGTNQVHRAILQKAGSSASCTDSSTSRTQSIRSVWATSVAMVFRKSSKDSGSCGPNAAD